MKKKSQPEHWYPGTKWTGPGWAFNSWQQLAEEYEKLGTAFPYAEVQRAVWGAEQPGHSWTRLLPHYRRINMSEEIGRKDPEYYPLLSFWRDHYDMPEVSEIPYVTDDDRLFNFIVRRIYRALRPAYEEAWQDHSKNPRKLREHISRVVAPLEIIWDSDPTWEDEYLCPNATFPIHRAITNMK